MKVRSLAHFLNQTFQNYANFTSATSSREVEPPQSLQETSFLPRSCVKPEDESLRHRRPAVHVQGPPPKGDWGRQQVLGQSQFWDPNGSLMYKLHKRSKFLMVFTHSGHSPIRASLVQVRVEL